MFNTGRSMDYQSNEQKFGANCPHLDFGAANSQGNTWFANSGANVFAKSGSEPATPSAAPVSKEPEDANEFIKQVIGELTPWDKNLMWPLSSFAPLKGSRLVPGFTDTSMEECRLNAYEAVKANDPDMMQTFFRKKIDDHNRVLQAYRTLQQKCKEALIKIFMDHAAKTGGNAKSAFGSSSPILFGAKSTSTSSPSGCQPSTSGGSMFGGRDSSAFGTSDAFKPARLFQSTSNSTFGRSQSTGTAYSATGQSSFGTSDAFKPARLFQSTSNSTFGRSQSTGTAFSATGQSSFGTSDAFKPARLFQSTSNSTSGRSQSTSTVFGATGQSSFGTSDAFKPAPLFRTTSNSTFGRSQSTGTPCGAKGQSAFGSSAQSVYGSSAFCSQNQSTNAFGSSFGFSNNRFGNSNSQNQSAFGANAQTSSFGSGQSSAFGAGTSSSGLGSSQNPAFRESNLGSTFGASNNNQTSSFSSPNQQPFGSTTQGPGGFVPVSNITSLGGASPSRTPFGASTNSPFASTAIQGYNPFVQITPQPTPSSPFAPVPPQTFSPFMQNTAQQPGAFVSPSQPSTTNNSQGLGNTSSERVSMDVSYLFTIDEESCSTTTTCNSSTNCSIYSDISSLSEQDLAQFKAETFTYIPHCPPPLELCDL